MYHQSPILSITAPDQYSDVVYGPGLQTEYTSCFSPFSSSAPTFLLLYSTFSNFLAVSHSFSEITYPHWTANSVPSVPTLGFGAQHNVHDNAAKRERREWEDYYNSVLLPGDVISVTVKGGREERDDRETSISKGDKRWVALERKKTRRVGRGSKAGYLIHIPFISLRQELSPDASWRRNPVISFSSHWIYVS